MGVDEPHREPRLRIGELAGLAGTTSRAVRHYHAIGLLAEPVRDDSGYRRYGAEHLVRLVRIRRLRMLDMPLEQIALHLSGDRHEPDDLQAALRSLADDITRQIEELQERRLKLLDLAASRRLAAPAETWQAALRAHGLLDESRTLPAGEHAAVGLLDALHPRGVEGVVAQSSGLLSDPALVARFEPLLERFRSLPDDDAAIELLAAEVAAVLPRPAQAAPPVDVETMDKLLGDRFTPAQRRFLQRLRQLLEASDR
jgi:DNA-binding transcriptional MerR regulator